MEVFSILKTLSRVSFLITGMEEYLPSSCTPYVESIYDDLASIETEILCSDQ